MQARSRRVVATDGQELVVRELGEGRPVLLVHGFMGDGRQWLDHGHAELFAQHGHRVLVPDLRAHGRSARADEAAYYPSDVLALDLLDLVEGLDLESGGYDLVGYSLGGRVVLRALVRGARPGRAVVAGQGYDVLDASTARTDGYRRALRALAEPSSGTPMDDGWMTALVRDGADPRALLGVLDSMVATSTDELAAIDVPTLVLVGDEDERSGSERLAAAIPGAAHRRVPGGHDAFLRPDFGEAVLAFLDGHEDPTPAPG